MVCQLNVHKPLMLAFFFISFFASAQDSINTINKVSISSPTAASLGKYGDYPVNYNTGVPDISIPLYTVKSKDITVPIGLSYHASGLKVQEVASWVGTGWSLNAGGVITRTVVGTPDDRGITPSTFTHGHYSDYGYNNYLFIAGSGYGVTLDGKLPDDAGFLNGYKDGEPDLFSFNFNGIAGKFYFNDDRSVVTVPEMDIKVQTDYTLGTGFNGFTVTTADGTKYFFGKTGNNNPTVNPVETTVPMTPQDGPAFGQRANSSWYLNKIVNFDNTDSVLFSYAAETYGYYTLSMFPCTFYSKGTIGSPGQIGYNLVKNLVTGVRLTGITFLNGNIVFTPTLGARTDLTGYNTTNIAEDPSIQNTTSFSLGDMQVNNNSGFCKKFVFKYGYFQDNGGLQGDILSNYNSTINTDKKHLRLDTLTEMSCDGTVQVSPYLFNYYSETVRRSLSMGMDHWGFANGVTTNSTLIPTHYVKYSGGIYKKDGADRDAVFPAMRGGALQKITFPTGGFTQFDYEPNTTWVNYNTYKFIQRKTMSAGYDGHNGFIGDGGSNPIENSFTFTGNQYDLLVTNTDNVNISSEDANVYIYNSAHSSVVWSSSAVTQGQQKTFTLQLAAGSYYIQLWKTNASTGNGAFLSLTEKVPTPVAGNDTVGGLRIKTITTNNGVNTNNIVTNYSYDVGTQSSGILYSRPVYVKLAKNKTYNEVFPVGANPTCQILLASGNGFEAFLGDQYYMSPVSVRPMQTVQGNHIGYNEVKVTQTGNGYSIYRYYGSNYWDSRISDVCSRMVDWDNPCDAYIPETPAAPVDIEPKRGELKYEGHYNESGQILKDVWHFPAFKQSDIITPGHITTNANGTGVYTEYMLTSYKKTVDSVEETMYDPIAASSITTKKIQYFDSKYHNKPTQIATYSSDNKRLATNLSYVFDFLPSTCTSISDGISSYKTNIHNDTLRYYDTLPKCTPQTGGANSCRYKAHIQFRRDINLHRISFMTYRRDTYTPNFDAAQNTAESAALADLKPVLELQDLYRNSTVEKSSWRNNLLLKSQYTTYSFSTNPSGPVYPSLLQDITVYSPTSTFTKAVINGSNNAITRDSRYQNNTSYLFDLGNLVEFTGRDGITTSYKWGLNNTQPVVIALGVSYATLNTAYTAVGGNLTTLRSQASLSSALLSTYTYTPLVGINTETSPTLQKFTYEYDALFRLQHVKDRYNNILKRYEYKFQRPVTD